MQPGNLVFLVIVAIWAVYLVQHWIRRREHVATARSVDRFSEAMRVLERRAPLSRADLGAPHPPSYAVRPPSARPALMVKRAPAVSGTSSSLGSRPSMSEPSRSRPVRRPSRELPVRRSSRELLVRRVRGVAFLVTLAAIPVTFVLALADVLLWVSVAIAVAAFVVVVAGLRAAVKRDLSVRRAARTAARRRYAPPGASSASRPSRPTSADWGENASSSAHSHPNPERGPGSSRDSDPAAADSGLTAAADSGEATAAFGKTGTEAASTRPTDEVYDVTAYVARTAEPSTTPWSPVPVPPPTYTLKDAAARSVPEPADVSQVPIPIEVEDDELERLMAQRHRRIVG